MDSTKIISEVTTKISKKRAIKRQATAQHEDIELNKIAVEIKKDFINYKALTGREVINRYLIDKHHWLPEKVYAFKYEELITLLTEYT
jgi:hypothetical protein